MFQSLKNKLRKIQESDENVKKRWLIIMSALSMLIVVGLWIVLFNSSIGNVRVEKEEKINDTSFLRVFNAGLKSIGGSGFDEIKKLYNQAIGEMFIEVEK